MREGKGCCWYVVHTKPKQEVRAELNLHSWGIETLFPKIREPRSAQYGRLSYLVSPLFPGYLFARFDARNQLAKVRFTRGVHSVVGFGECATAVDESMMSLIRNKVGSDGVVAPTRPQVGDRVEILTGPLRSLVGLFERELSSRDRVSILLAAVGCQMRVELPSTLVRKLGGCFIGPDEVLLSCCDRTS